MGILGEAHSILVVSSPGRIQVSVGNLVRTQASVGTLVRTQVSVGNLVHTQVLAGRGVYTEAGRKVSAEVGLRVEGLRSILLGTEARTPGTATGIHQAEDTNYLGILDTAHHVEWRSLGFQSLHSGLSTLLIA